MCAIFGIIGDTSKTILKKMSSCQMYRGPDSQKFYINHEQNVSLGMNRLAVIDKKMGSQPMISQDKRFVVVFNGAIFNFNEIKFFLKKKNIKFKTNSDTEVLLNAFSFWHTKCFNYFDGMWAVGIYDLKEKSFYLSRDYLGQKPLFYYQDKSKLLFSSQINGIFQYKNDFNISIKNYNEYLRYSYFPAPSTLYKKLYQVMPGEVLEFSNKKIKRKKYWNLDNGGDYNLFFKKKETNDIESEFQKIISNYLVADKKPALCLSAGLDSFLLKKFLLNKEKSINSVTIGFKDKSYDESRFVEKDKKNLNTKVILSKRNIITSFNKIKKNIYFPIGDSSIIPTYNLFKIVRKKTNVSLSGDGGDEMFFGYEAFKGYFLMIYLKKVIPNFILKALQLLNKKIKLSYKYMSISKKIKFFLKYIDKELYLTKNYWISNFDERDSNEYFVRKRKDLKTFKILKKLFTNSPSKMDYAQNYFIKHYLPLILLKVDFSSMLNSVENRSPILSKSIINFSIDLRSGNNFRFFKNRYLMKKIFFRYLEDKKEIKKHGFAFNLNEILENKKLILSNIDFDLIYNKKFFLKKYLGYLSGNFEYEKYLWNEIMINFCRQNLEKK